MRSQTHIKLAKAIRAELSEFAEKWVRFVRANELVPDFGDPLEELINKAYLGFEVLAGLLEGIEYRRFQNVIRRLLHEWINNTGTYDELFELENVFPAFVLSRMGLDPESDEGQEVVNALIEFLHSDIRLEFIHDYLHVYEDIIGAESRHIAYVLAHFDAILSLTAHLNAADTREEILDGIPVALQALFDNVEGAGIWVETTNKDFICWSLRIQDDEIPQGMIIDELPQSIIDIYNQNMVRSVGKEDIPKSFINQLDVEPDSELSACVIPVRPKEAEGALILVVVSATQPEVMELSLGRIASAECALALDRAAGRAKLAKVNYQIRNILNLNRQTSWGTSYHETSEAIVENLLKMTGGSKALLLACHPTSHKSLAPVAWRGIDQNIIESYRRGVLLHPLIVHSINGAKIHILPSDRLSDILGKQSPPDGFAPSEMEALGVFPIRKQNESLGVCLFLCPKSFASEADSRNVLSIFAKAAADSLSASREYERGIVAERIARQEALRARILQEHLTPKFCRNGRVVFWGYIEPATDIAGDVFVVRPDDSGGLTVWVADVAGRGVAAVWGMIYLRQLLTELAPGAYGPSEGLKLINQRLFEIENESPAGGMFATGAGLRIEPNKSRIRFSRAGAPKIYRVTREGYIESTESGGFPLGLFQDANLQDEIMPFKEGEKLVWVSDGMLGTLNANGVRWGENRFVECLKKAWFLPPRALYESILASLGEFGAVENPHDDRSLLVIGYDLKETWRSSKPGSDLNKLINDSLSYLLKAKLSSKDFYFCRLLIDEAVKNAHEHGNRKNAGAVIGIKITVDPNYVHIRVHDEGGRLNEKATKASLKLESILEDKGRGFLLMRNLCDYLWVEDDTGEFNAVKIREKCHD